MKQKDAVYSAIKKVLENAGAWFVEGQEAVVLRREDREAVVDELVKGFMQGGIELDSGSPSNSDKLQNEASLRTYCSGLVSNWLRKDKRLNGGVVYFSPKRLLKHEDR